MKTCSSLWGKVASILLIQTREKSHWTTDFLSINIFSTPTLASVVVERVTRTCYRDLKTLRFFCMLRVRTLKWEESKKVESFSRVHKFMCSFLEHFTLFTQCYRLLAPSMVDQSKKVYFKIFHTIFEEISAASTSTNRHQFLEFSAARMCFLHSIEWWSEQKNLQLSPWCCTKRDENSRICHSSVATREYFFSIKGLNKVIRARFSISFQCLLIKDYWHRGEEWGEQQREGVKKPQHKTGTNAL